MSDISDQNEAGADPNDLLRLAHKRFSMLVRNLPVGIVIASELGYIEAVNPAVASLFEYKDNELMGKHVNCLLHSAPWSEPENLPDWCRENVGRSIELKGQNSSQELVAIDLSVRVFDGETDGRLLIMIQDATERYVANKLKQDLFRMIHHDIRSPLAGVLATLEVLQIDENFGSLSDYSLNAIERAKGNIDRITSLVEGLLELERINSGLMHLEKERIALNSAIAQAIASVQDVSRRKNIEIRLLPTAATIEADAVRLEQVLVNLMGNAVAHSEPAKPIEISVIEMSDTIRIAVRDNGPGVPDAIKPTIFDSFKQGAKKSAGFGLGLAICKQIVVAHGGTIGLEDAPGRGTIFWFDLPKNPNGSLRLSE